MRLLQVCDGRPDEDFLNTARPAARWRWTHDALRMALDDIRTRSAEDLRERVGG